MYTSLFDFNQNRKSKKRYNSGIFTISIGNFHIGGTGKTPILCSILEDFSTSVVVSRGYKRVNNKHKTYFTSTDSVFDVGDEAKLVLNRYNNRFLIGANRSNNIKEFLKTDTTEMFILDDGFQHVQVHRDLDIVLVDLSKYDIKKFEHDTLPYIYAREASTSLARADIIIFTKDDESKLANDNRQFILDEYKDKCTFNTQTKLHYPMNINFEPLMTSSAIVISGIADNDRFLHSVKDFGIEVSNHFTFDDHHNYTRAEIDKLNLFMSKGKSIITTEKDFVKISELIDNMYQANIFYTKYDILVPGLNSYILDFKQNFLAQH